MKNTAAIALLLARASAQDADVSKDRAFKPPAFEAATAETECTDADVTTAKQGLVTAEAALKTANGELKTAEELVATKTAAQVKAVKAVADKDKAVEAVLKADRDAALLSLKLRIAMNDAERASIAADAAYTTADTALTNANTAKTNADNAKTAADAAKVAATNHEAFELLELNQGVTALNLAITNWTGAGSDTDYKKNPFFVKTVGACKNGANTAGTDKGTKTLAVCQTECVASATCFAVALLPNCTHYTTGFTGDATAGKECYTTASVATTAKVKALLTTGSTFDAKPAGLMKLAKTALDTAVGKARAGAVAATGNMLKKETMDTAKDAALAAFNMKETMLTAYCVQSVALGSDVADDLTKGREALSYIEMGQYGSTAEASQGTQLGWIKTSSALDAKAYNSIDAGTKVPDSNKPYRCVTTGETAIGNNLVRPPTDLTQNAARSAAQGSTTPKKKLMDALNTANNIYKDTCVLVSGTTANKEKECTSVLKPELLLSASCNWSSPNCTRKTAADDIATKFALWKTVSDTTMDKFALMITYAATDYVEEGTTKACQTGAGNANSLVNTAAVNQSTGFLKKIRDVDGKLLVVPTVTGANKAKMLEACGKLCSALPGYKYYKAEACATKETCCMGISYASTGANDGIWNASCKLISGTTAVAAEGGAVPGHCYKRSHSSGTASNIKSQVWQTKALLSMNDTTAAACSSSCGDTVKGVGTQPVALYTAFTTKVTNWKTKRALAMDEAKTYFVAKRLNKKMAAAYKTSFDVYAARWAAYAGVTGTDITGTSVKKLYDDAKAKVDSTSSCSNAADCLNKKHVDAVAADKVVQDIYNTKKMAYDTGVTEYAAQKLITVQAGKDAAAAATAATNAATAVGAVVSVVGNPAYKAATKATKAKADALADKTAKKKAWDDAATGAKKAYDDQVLVATAKKTAAKTATTDIELLRVAATKAATATNEAADAATAKRLIVSKAATGKQALVDAAKATLAAKLLACKNTKWDTYKSNLTKAIAARDTDIGKIKTLLKERAAAAPKYVDGGGAKGARCEKAMTSGSMGPRRGAKTCTAETDCCGAAKKLDAATGLLMTVEVCWTKTEKKYTYQPPRGPMQLTMPATEADWTFACIEGAQKLVAASAALATAAYMMA